MVKHREELRLAYALGAAMLTLVTIILFHAGKIGWGILGALIIGIVWFSDNKTNDAAIALAFLFGGFVEFFGYTHKTIGIIYLILASMTWFIPKRID